MIKSVLITMGLASGLTIAGGVSSLSTPFDASYTPAEQSYLNQVEKEIAEQQFTTTFLVYESVKPRSLIEYGKRACAFYRTGKTSDDLTRLQITQQALDKKTDVISVSNAKLTLIANRAAEINLCPVVGDTW